jgi:hypothetical protein
VKETQLQNGAPIVAEDYAPLGSTTRLWPDVQNLAEHRRLLTRLQPAHGMKLPAILIAAGKVKEEILDADDAQGR